MVPKASVLVERLRPRIEADEVLRDLAGSHPVSLAGVGRYYPSGVDKVVCVVAKTALRTRRASVAVTVPRGQHGLALFVGAYLVRWLARLPRQQGSVLVSSRGADLRDQATKLRIPGGRLQEPIAVGRLATMGLVNGRSRPAFILFGQRGRSGLDQRDHHLLLALPNAAPPLAENIVSAAVENAAGAAPDSWVRSHARHQREDRRQVWIGELGDPRFERFCEESGTPIFRIDWRTAAEAASAFGEGETPSSNAWPLTLTALCRRAHDPPAPAFITCHHSEFEEELENATHRLAAMRRRAHDEVVPDAAQAALRLVALFGRLASPLDDFDDEASRNPFMTSTFALLQQVRNARSSTFGRSWRRGHGAHWASVEGSLVRLREILDDACPKWWAVIERIDKARLNGEHLRIVCQTKSERSALERSLGREGIISPEDQAISFVTFQQIERLGVITGPVSVYLAPPPPWFASTMLSAEQGCMEVLCYSLQVDVLKRSYRRIWHNSLDDVNRCFLNNLGITPSAERESSCSAPELKELEPFVWDSGSTGSTSRNIDDGILEFWEDVVRLYGREYDAHYALAGQADGDTPSGPVTANLVVFREGPRMYFAQGAACDVIRGSGGGSRLVQLAPAQLTPGMHVAVLPGAARGGLLEELLDAWDEKLGPAGRVYDALWRTALSAAVKRLGIDEIGSQLGVRPQTVDDWANGRRWPQKHEWMAQVIRASQLDAAQQNAEPIIRYISHTRGMHRLIGRVLNDAVTETVVNGDGVNLRDLEAIVGRELDDLFAAVQILTVAEVGEAEEVAQGLLGHLMESG